MHLDRSRMNSARRGEELGQECFSRKVGVQLAFELTNLKDQLDCGALVGRWALHPELAEPRETETLWMKLQICCNI